MAGILYGSVGQAHSAAAIYWHVWFTKFLA